MTSPVSTGTTVFSLTSWNASLNVALTFACTGISAGMPEYLVTQTITQQISSSLYASGNLFAGCLGLITDPVSAAFNVNRTDHVMSLFSQCQYDFEVVSDTTGTNYYIDNIPVLTTVADAMAFAPLANQLLQSCSGGPLSIVQIIDLLAMSSADLVSTLRNNIVSCYYVKYYTTLQTNAIRLDNRPVQYWFNPYTLRPTIIQLAVAVASWVSNSVFEVDFQSGWMTFRFAQDQLFNYEPFDYQNQFYLGYLAGNNYIPREIRDAVLKWSYILQTSGFSNVKSISDGNSKIEYELDKNTEKRNIFAPIRRYCQ
jgi:hypothetical protein